MVYFVLIVMVDSVVPQGIYQLLTTNGLTEVSLPFHLSLSFQTVCHPESTSDRLSGATKFPIHHAKVQI